MVESSPAIEMKSVSGLEGAPYNPRTISEKALKGLRASVERFGMVEPIVWNKRTEHIVGGHQRLKVLVAMGVKDTPVVVVDLPIVEEKALNVALNSPEIAGEFTADLEGILGELQIEEPQLFIDLRLDVLGDAQGYLPDEPEAVEDDFIPPKEPKYKVERGDIWLLGRNRLMCGDSTSEEDTKTLVGEAIPRIMFTDPPWNVAVGTESTPKWRQREEPLIGDTVTHDEFEHMLNSFARIVVRYISGDIYCVMGAKQWPYIDAALREAGWHWGSTIVWKKSIHVIGRANYHRKYEPIWYGWKDKSSWNGLRDQNDVWDIDKPRASPEHPTMKPIPLMAKAIANSSRPGDIVLDPFGGSGSTLIAADQLDRTCYMMEIDPRYCSVIIERWEKLTGERGVGP